MQYAIEYDVFGAHRVRVITEEVEGKKQNRIERVGDDPAEPEIDKTLPLHHLMLMWTVAKDLASRKVRMLPMTKGEAENFIPKKGIKLLLKAGLISAEMLRVYDHGRPAGQRSCYPLTELGRRYCRSLYEKVPGNTDEEGSDSLGDLVVDGEGIDLSTLGETGPTIQTEGSPN